MPPADSVEDAARDLVGRELLVACLCAQWCRTCDPYLDTLMQVREAITAMHAQAAVRFVWVDIEDDADLLGDLDIEDFPTIVLARGHEVVFAGPVLPHAQTLQRLVREALVGELPRPGAPWPADVLALPARLAQRPAI